MRFTTAAALVALGLAGTARAQATPDTTAPAAPAAPAAPTSPTVDAAAPAPAPKAATPKTVVSGKIYADYTYRQNMDDGRDVSADKGVGTSLDVKRFYLGVDHTFDEVWRARIRTDIGNLTNGKFDVFVKHAYLEAKVAPELGVKAGAADLPWVPFVEDLYGFRYVENVLTDRVKLATSADWGLHAGGKLAGGLVDYAVSAVNGRGYGDPTRTRAPAVEARLALVPVKGLTLAVGGQTGYLGQNVVGTATPNKAQRADALVAWVGGGARVGVSGFVAKNYDKAIVTGTAPTDKAIGGSAWASYEIVPALTLFARADYVQPKKDTSSDLKDVYVNGGIQYEPVKPVDLALVYKREQVKSGTLSTSNGTIGSTVAGEKGTYDEVGLFAQLSF
ncbi:hypothetical protein [Anaeromyxobacter oryzae]|uniref:Phosphate-selective porin O and P n=1 Tax=Anaeromyxobacter oryzae TaxID=2918170 RepID=A0ABM7WWX1_9BACT|nr:hypothetical protein [Anaeromyxobacter oryzae]BDG04004.1 hypothetical protein AMOR_30000 [Anaeromyxobacter oryzae]